MTTALLLVNPNARNGNSDILTALTMLTDAGIELRELQPSSREAVSQTIIDHAANADMVIVGGGDGTVNAAIRGVYETKLPIAVLPLGTANDFARSLKVPLTLQDAAQAIISNRQEKIDMGQLNTHYFVNVSHIGLTVDVALSSNTREKKLFSIFAYILAMSRALKRNRRFTAVIRHDDAVTRTRCNNISVGNGRNYGGGMVIAEKARIDDSRLDLVTWRRQSLLRLFVAAVRMRSGRHIHLKEVSQLTASTIKIDTEQPMQVAADGELLTTTPVTYRCHTDAITAVVGEEF